MAYRMKGFSGFGNSPLKQGPTYEQIRQLGPKPTGTKGASEWWKKVRKLKGPSTPPAEKTISQTKEILKKDIKKVAGDIAKKFVKRIPVIGGAVMAYDVLKTGVKRIAEGIKTGKPKTKLTGPNIKDTWKRVPKKKYTK
mgnify:CR=1 FL=1